MSTLKVNTIQDTTGNDALTIDSSGNVTASQGFVPSTQLSHRNLIINGAMQVAQRGTSKTGINTSGYKTVDRFNLFLVNSAVLSSLQSTDAPDGFANSLKWEVTTADTSIGSNEYAQIGYKIEAQDLQHLSYGTSSAKTVTLSFWVKSNKTGTYCLSYVKDDTTRYDYVAEYTINSANTWEQKVITIVPDSNIQASGGAIANDNGQGVTLKFILATGSSRYGTNNTWNSTIPADATSNQVNWLDSTSNNFYLTGVQLEVGSVATPFEHRSYGEELARCQRYYYQTGTSGYTGIYGTTCTYTNINQYHEAYGVACSTVEMRTAPSITTYDADGNSGKVSYYISGTGTPNKTGTVNGVSSKHYNIYSDNTTSKGGMIWHFTADSEL